MFGFVFFAVGAHEFVVELEVYPHAGGAWYFERGCTGIFHKAGHC